MAKPPTSRESGQGTWTDPERRISSPAPRVGQPGKPYTSGSNAHGVHQPRRQGPAPGPQSRGDGPRKPFTGR